MPILLLRISDETYEELDARLNEYAELGHRSRDSIARDVLYRHGDEVVQEIVNRLTMDLVQEQSAAAVAQAMHRFHRRRHEVQSQAGGG